MRIKRTAALTVLLLLMSAFLISMTAFAAPDGGDVSVPDSGQTNQPVQTTNTGGSTGAFTPNGQGSVLDYVENGTDEKRFYTITTPSGNVFYLIIDEARDEQNVYFLNAVTESDLMALAEKDNGVTLSSIPSADTCTCKEKCEYGAVNTDCPVCRNDLNKCEGHTASTVDEASASRSGGNSDTGIKSNILMYGIVIVAFVAIAGVGVYKKIIRPKKQGNRYADEDEAEDYGESADEYDSPDYLPDDDADE